MTIVDPIRPWRAAAASDDPAVRCALAWHGAAHVLAVLATGTAVPDVSLSDPCPTVATPDDYGGTRARTLVAACGPLGSRCAPGWTPRTVAIPCPGDSPADLFGLADEARHLVVAHGAVLDALGEALEAAGTLTGKQAAAIWTADRPALRRVSEAIEGEVHALTAHAAAHAAAGDLTRLSELRRHLATLGYEYAA